MKYRQLGTSGLQVSAVGLGCSTIGEVVHGDEAVALIRHAISLGVTFLDTAITYAGGRSEELVGRAIAGRRAEVVLATKVGLRAGDGPYLTGLSRRRIISAVEESLTRLGTDHIDLYQAHRPDPQTPLEETLEAMDSLTRSGKVLYVGMSNYSAWQHTQAAWLSDRRGLTTVVSAQNRFNLLDGPDDPHLLDAASELGLGLIPYQPFAAGVLTGKYQRGAEPPAGTRAGDVARFRGEVTDERVAAVERLKPWAASHDRSVAELSIAWLLAHPEVSSIVAGARTPLQLDHNVRAADWTLTVAERDEARRIVLGRPDDGLG